MPTGATDAITGVITEAITEAPSWCTDPRPWFSCPDCRAGLWWVDCAHGELLVCGSRGCVSAGIVVSVGRAQRHRIACGLDVAVPAGWPRPVLAGRPVPWVVPVTAGRPWWRMTDGLRLVACQNDALCQVCGLSLDLTPVGATPEPGADPGTGPDARASREQPWWVLVDEHGAVESDAAMHQQCAQLAAAVCPHLMAARPNLRAVAIERGAILADGQTWRPGTAWTRQRWTIATPARAADHRNRS